MMEISGRVAPLFPPENIYGHTKKLHFLLDQVRQALAEKPTIRLLDFGCGNGSAVSQFLMLPGVRYYGVDIHGPSLEFARERFGGPDSVFLDDVPSDIEFDLIVYSDNLEHLENPYQVMQSHVRQLVPSGRVVGAVPNGQGPFEIEKKIDNRFALQSRLDRVISYLRSERSSNAPPIPYNSDSGHLQFFTEKALRALFSEVGLQIVEFRNGVFLGAPFSERLFLRHRALVALNARVADILPARWVSTWYFAAKNMKA